MTITKSTTCGHHQGKLARMTKDGCKKLHRFHGTRAGRRIVSRSVRAADPTRCPASSVSWWEETQEDSDPDKTEGKLATN